MEHAFKITVFTPTYNRAHTLPSLYASLLRQGDANSFEWLIVDDCSTDDTSHLVERWIDDGVIAINYKRLEKNGGKPRAINVATALARSPYIFIVDSDDYLVDNIIPLMLPQLDQLDTDSDVIGVGVMRVHADGKCFAKPQFKDFVDATNLERRKYGLDVDCNEAYRVSILRKYPFQVWPGENFTPESTVLNQMAFDGYKIRWLNVCGVVADYQEDGLTKGSWRLQQRNPMGYALLYNSNIKHSADIRSRLYNAMQFGAQCLLGRHPEYILKTNSLLCTVLTLPMTVIVYLRRLWQYRSL